MKYNIKFTKIEDGYYRAKINNVELWEVDELLVWTIKEREKEIERLNNIINELVKFMDEDYEYYKKYGYAEQGHAMGQIRRIKNKLQELKGSE